MDFDQILNDLSPNPAIAAKERIRAILEQQAEDVLNGTSSVKPKKPKPTSTKPKKADYNKATYEHYKQLGYYVYRVDYYDARFQRQHDLLGFADMMALKEGQPPLLIQLTSKANMNERVKKINALASSTQWRSTGGAIHVIGWEKVNGRNQPTIKEIN
jgi:hypothetical protein